MSLRESKIQRMLDAKDKDRYAIEIKMVDQFLKLPESLATRLVNSNRKVEGEW